MILPATEYVDDLFDQLAELLIATEEMNKDRELATSESMLKFPHISRPTRLVLNRPIFRDYEAIMSKKLGDFLQVHLYTCSCKTSIHVIITRND